MPEQHREIISQTLTEAKILYGLGDTKIDLPTVELSDPDKLSYLCQETNSDCEIKGYFDNGRIVLDRSWKPEDPMQLSYLVHEFVHYFQYLDDRGLSPGACVENYKIETEAYTVQSNWLISKGQNGLSRDYIDSAVLATLRC